MVPIAQWSLDHGLDGLIEGESVCLIGSGRGCALRPLLAFAAYCAHAGVPPLVAPLLDGGGALFAALLPPLGSCPLIKAV